MSLLAPQLALELPAESAHAYDDGDCAGVRAPPPPAVLLEHTRGRRERELVVEQYAAADRCRLLRELVLELVHQQVERKLDGRRAPRAGALLDFLANSSFSAQELAHTCNKHSQYEYSSPRRVLVQSYIVLARKKCFVLGCNVRNRRKWLTFE